MKTQDRKKDESPIDASAYLRAAVGKRDAFREALKAAADSIQMAVSQAEEAIQQQLEVTRFEPQDLRPSGVGESADEAAQAAYSTAMAQVRKAAEHYEEAAAQGPSTDPPAVPGIGEPSVPDPAAETDQLMRSAVSALNEAMATLVESATRTTDE